MINEDEKAKKLDKWLELQKRWLHEKISLGKIFDVIQMAFYEGFEEGSKENDICTGCENPGNRWHFDEFPSDESDILCQIAKDEFIVGYYRESKKRYYTIDGQEIDVIAWKEIIPPKKEK